MASTEGIRNKAVHFYNVESSLVHLGNELSMCLDVVKKINHRLTLFAVNCLDFWALVLYSEVKYNKKTNSSVKKLFLNRNLVTLAKYVNKDLLRKIAIRLKELRSDRGITQSALYEDTGINISRIERGVNDISISNLERICQYFEISLETFFKGLQ